ncbi:MAG: UDP-N-acetylmuramate--L-alanine ligase [Deltaproteobacteria bacterium]|nr:UDP-N-acetylmuramate--L-alanine ligase [Deltaproteobacteria bacterium]
MNLVSKHYHFIGIGGIGMSGLAELLVRQGYKVSGSDLAANALTEKLEHLGVRFFRGHAPDNVLGSEVVVISSAIGLDNPELRAAQATGLPVLSRAQMLAALMAEKRQIAIAGAHGKTTTTTMVASVLRQGGLAPSVMVGAVADALGSNAVLDQGNYFVAEADESDGSFLVLKPHVAVVTNVDREHLDHYRDLSHIQEVFAKFIHQVQPDGLLVACHDDPHVRPLLAGVRTRLVTYGLTDGGDYRARDIQVNGAGSSYILLHQEKEMGRIQIPLAGRHYVCNSLAAAAVGFALGLDFTDIRAGLARLGKIKRRFEIKGEAQGITVIDDYGHHPTEIRVTLAAMAQAYSDRRLVVAFQPHRYSRTQALLPEFFPIFAEADLLFLTDIYGAGERVIPGLSGRDLYHGVRDAGHPDVYYVADRKELASKLWCHLRPGDVLVTMGAGDIWQTGEEILRRLATRPLPAGIVPETYAVQSSEAC